MIRMISSSDVNNFSSPVNEATVGSTSLVPPNTPSSISLADIAKSQRKDLNYLFKLDITKKKLEEILDNVTKALSESLELQNDIEYLKSELSFVVGQYYESESNYQADLISFSKSLLLHNISNSKLLFDKEFQGQFMSDYASQFSKADQKSAMEEGNKIIEELVSMYFNLEIRREFFENRKQLKEQLEKQLKNLEQQYTDKQKLIRDIDKQYQEVDNQGLLMSYEFSGEQPTMKDFIASPEITQQLERLITLCNNKEQLASYHIDFPKGVLLVGDQDAGKTFIAKVLSSEISRKMYHIKAHDLFSEESTDPNDMITDFFFTVIDYVQKNNESYIIFLDEMEKIINSAGEYNPTQQKIITNTLIKNIINIQKSDLDIMIVGAVSNLKHIDPKLLKYDIFDNQFFLGLPKASERKRFFEYYIKKAEEKLQKPIFSVESFDRVVQKTDGFSAEYIKQIISSCVKEYLYQELQLHTPSPIDEALLIKKINELKLEDKIKGKPRYFAG